MKEKVMTRLWHWNQAEAALEAAAQAVDAEREQYHLGRAQVHATLAAAPQECPIDPSFFADE